MLKVHNHLQLEARWGDVIMTSSWQLDVKMKAKIILRPEMDLRDVNMKYGRLVVFKSHDSAEILGFRYGLTPVIGTLKIMAIILLI